MSTPTGPGRLFPPGWDGQDVSKKKSGWPVEVLRQMETTALRDELRRREQTEAAAEHERKVRELAEARRRLEVSFVAKLKELFPDLDISKVGKLTDMYREFFEEEEELF